MTLLQQSELRQGTIMGASRTVRGPLVKVLVKDDVGLACVLVLEVEALEGGK